MLVPITKNGNKKQKDQACRLHAVQLAHYGSVLFKYSSTSQYKDQLKVIINLLYALSVLSSGSAPLSNSYTVLEYIKSYMQKNQEDWVKFTCKYTVTSYITYICHRKALSVDNVSTTLNRWPSSGVQTHKRHSDATLTNNTYHNMTQSF